MIFKGNKYKLICIVLLVRKLSPLKVASPRYFLDSPGVVASGVNSATNTLLASLLHCLSTWPLTIAKNPLEKYYSTMFINSPLVAALNPGCQSCAMDHGTVWINTHDYFMNTYPYFLALPLVVHYNIVQETFIHLPHSSRQENMSTSIDMVLKTCGLLLTSWWA